MTRGELEAVLRVALAPAGGPKFKWVADSAGEVGCIAEMAITLMVPVNEKLDEEAVTARIRNALITLAWHLETAGSEILAAQGLQGSSWHEPN